MADEPEIKEDDPVEAIRGALNRALASLKKLLGQEEQELQEEMAEVEGVIQGGSSSSGPVDDQVQDQNQDGK